MKKIMKCMVSTLLIINYFNLAPLYIFADENKIEDKSDLTNIYEMNSSISNSESSTVESETSEEMNGTTDTSSSIIDSSESNTNDSSSSSENMTESSTPNSNENTTESSTTESSVGQAKPQQSNEYMKDNATTIESNERMEQSSGENKSTFKEDKAPRSNYKVESFDENELKFENNISLENFIKEIGELAREIGHKNDLYASVMIAQAILESSYGQSQLAQAPNYNLFGIKGSYKGQAISLMTHEEDRGGQYYSTQSIFRKYSNYYESLEDYAKLLKEGLPENRYFYRGAWKSNTESYKEATKFLTGRYATDHNYNKKLNGLIKTYNLTKYDKELSGPSVVKGNYAAPLKNYIVSSSFGSRDEGFHRGIDLAAPQGTPIYASKAGVVIKAEYHYSWGNYVVILHEDGMTTLYAHQQNFIVDDGDAISQGQTIGYVGSTGNSTGPHLHFELCKDTTLSQNMLVDPQSIFD